MCRDVLCNAEAAGYMTENFVVWAGDVSQPEAYKLSSQMGVTGFPFLAVFLCKGSTPTIPYLIHQEPEDPQLRSLGVQQTKHPLLLKRDEAVQDVDKLLPQLRKLVEEESIQLTAIRLEHEEREMGRAMREEQDAAYAAAEREDVEKERIRREKVAAEEEAERKAKAYAHTREQQVEERRARMLPEPEPGPGQARVLVRALDGSRITRRFDEQATLQAVFDWVDVTSPNPMDRSGDFKLVCSYPRLLFNMQEHSRTSLKDAGLSPDASLFVEEDWAEEAQVCHALEQRLWGCSACAPCPNGMCCCCCLETGITTAFLVAF
eukprot:COSAG02_NODE_805_length_16972_cov_36.668287_11_plen_320_part_00